MVRVVITNEGANWCYLHSLNNRTPNSSHIPTRMFRSLPPHLINVVVDNTTHIFIKSRHNVGLLIRKKS